ncbi:glycosyltransferase family 4 protein [Haloarchaeobius amylolyticus]|uniref:glycosyltransferase family 4 protein n=1 Tax=Haloarchaeobius amylolyticus TaxID=1198296 RepID=UPI002271E8E0|nr:glycosyltransferase family 4 protein [Haloarchaeobius amylolyticus]
MTGTQQTDIRPLLVNTADTGGSATATTRIHRGLRRLGVDSRLLVQEKSTDEPTVVGPESTIDRAWSLARPHVDLLPLRLYGKSGGFGINWLPERKLSWIQDINPDLIHLNWVWRGALSVRSIGRLSRPVVWRLPDMTAFTGGCHYSFGCDRFEERCGSCPQLDSSIDTDLSRIGWHRKAHHWDDLDLTIVTPSTWLAEEARRSSLFGDRRIEVIPNALDTKTYRPRDPSLGRDFFGLPSDKRLVLFGAVDPMGDHRKGADLLQEALQSLSGDVDDVELVVFGAKEPSEAPDFGFPTNYVGYLHDDPSLVMLYSAADVMVVPSRYEGFGQTVSESLACGTPVVAFDATGPSEIVDHTESGYLARPYDSEGLSRGIDWVLNEANTENLSETARERAVERYEQEAVAEQYLELYNSIL